MNNANIPANINSTALIQKNIDPQQIIDQATESTSSQMKADFLQQISHLYQYEIFKNILDLTVTKILQGHLKFIVKNALIFDLDAGNCQTVELIGDGGMLGWFKPKRNYRITIKKITSEVIIHEICHMVEKEIAEFFSLEQFSRDLLTDMYYLKSNNPALQQKAKSLFVDELRSYPEQQRQGELFVRYFQLFAGSQEVYYGDANMGRYNIAQLLKILPLATRSLEQQLKNRWMDLIDNRVANASKSYVKNIEEIKSTWAGRKIKPIHGTLNASKNGTKPTWRNNIKSIKDDPFA